MFIRKIKQKYSVGLCKTILLSYCVLLASCTTNPFIQDVCNKENNKQTFISIFNGLAAEVGSTIRVDSLIESKRPPMDMYCEVKFKLTDSQIITANYVIQMGSGWTYEISANQSNNPLQQKIADYFRKKANEQNKVAQQNRDKRVKDFLSKPVQERLQYCDIMYKLAVQRGVVLNPTGWDDFYKDCVYKGSQIYN